MISVAPARVRLAPPLPIAPVERESHRRIPPQSPPLEKAAESRMMTSQSVAMPASAPSAGTAELVVNTRGALSIYVSWPLWAPAERTAGLLTQMPWAAVPVAVTAELSM